MNHSVNFKYPSSNIRALLEMALKVCHSGLDPESSIFNLDSRLPAVGRLSRE